MWEGLTGTLYPSKDALEEEQEAVMGDYNWHSVLDESVLWEVAQLDDCSLGQDEGMLQFAGKEGVVG